MNTQKSTEEKKFRKTRNKSNSHIRTRKCSTILRMAWSWTIKFIWEPKNVHTRTQCVREKEKYVIHAGAHVHAHSHTHTQSQQNWKKAPTFYFGRRAMYYIGGFTLDCRFMRHATLRVYLMILPLPFSSFMWTMALLTVLQALRAHNVRVLDAEEAYRDEKKMERKKNWKGKKTNNHSTCTQKKK